ncbi:hypothetical protein BDV25DRAFT_163106 [Aspergillus avenaceus]|uniref:Uncharacterized protein n=1 Tax=Aspergillus avenaceus TaxID=36643 RepID=A0A5N6TJ44_ASPAV|nr:hypothetical protein BDV25DRAFT_163106 [Aspergillus avenaceus]
MTVKHEGPQKKICSVSGWKYLFFCLPCYFFSLFPFCFFFPWAGSFGFFKKKVVGALGLVTAIDQNINPPCLFLVFFRDSLGTKMGRSAAEGEKVDFKRCQRTVKRELERAAAW